MWGIRVPIGTLHVALVEIQELFLNLCHSTIQVSCKILKLAVSVRIEDSRLFVLVLVLVFGFACFWREPLADNFAVFSLCPYFRGI